MPSRPRTKTAKKKKEECPKITEIPIFENKIIELNRKLANIQIELKPTLEQTTQLINKKEQIITDRKDIYEHIERQLEVKTKECIELKDKIEKLKILNTKENEKHTEEYKRQADENEAMLNLVKSDKKILLGKLLLIESSMDERNALMNKFDEIERLDKEQCARHELERYEKERYVVIKKYQIGKNVVEKLTNLSDGFLKTSQMRIASHNQYLIRENIALNNEMDRLLIGNRRLQKQTDETIGKYDMAKNEHNISKLINKRLEKTERNQKLIIKQLQVNYKNLQLELFEQFILNNNYKELELKIQNIKTNIANNKKLLNEYTKQMKLIQTIKQKTIKEIDCFKNRNYQIKTLFYILSKLILINTENIIGDKYTIEKTNRNETKQLSASSSSSPTVQCKIKSQNNLEKMLLAKNILEFLDNLMQSNGQFTDPSLSKKPYQMNFNNSNNNNNQTTCGGGRGIVDEAKKSIDIARKEAFAYFQSISQKNIFKNAPSPSSSASLSSSSANADDESIRTHLNSDENCKQHHSLILRNTDEYHHEYDDFTEDSEEIIENSGNNFTFF